MKHKDFSEGSRLLTRFSAAAAEEGWLAAGEGCSLFCAIRLDFLLRVDGAAPV